MIGLNFTFDGQSSESYGISLVSIGSSENSDPFAPSQSIIEEKRYNSHIPLFHKVEKSPLEFEITLSLLEGDFTPEKRMELTKWLICEEYKEFISEDNPNKIYNVISTSAIELITFGSLKGYFKIRFRCDAPWAWSREYLTTFNLTNITTTITINNYSNVEKYLYPEIEFTLNDTNTSLTLVNLSNSSETSTFTNLTQLEKIYMNNERKQIISSLPLYRIGNFNKKWFRFVQGVNKIQVTGKCSITFRYKFPLLT